MNKRKTAAFILTLSLCLSHCFQHAEMQNNTAGAVRREAKARLVPHGLSPLQLQMIDNQLFRPGSTMWSNMHFLARFEKDVDAERLFVRRPIKGLKSHSTMTANTPEPIPRRAAVANRSPGRDFRKDPGQRPRERFARPRIKIGKRAEPVLGIQHGGGRQAFVVALATLFVDIRQCHFAGSASFDSGRVTTSSFSSTM